MAFFTWIGFGVIIGLITTVLDKENHTEAGAWSNITMGILGASTGGFLSSLIFGVNLNQFNLISLLSAGISSVLLLFVGNYLMDSA